VPGVHTGTDGVLHLGVPRSEVAGWLVVLLAVAAAGLADLRWGNGALAIACLVVVVVLGGTVVRPVLSAVTAHPEGHLLVRGSLGTARYEMEQIDAVVVAVLGPALGASTWLFRQLDGPRLPVLHGAELVLFGGADVPLPCTHVIPLPPLLRRLDHQVAALQAWLEKGPA